MERIVSVVVALLIYGFITFPIPSIILSILGIVGYLIYIKIRKEQHTVDDKMRREIALKTAQIYLSPYSDIWKNLKLSNKHCSLSLGNDGVTITCQEKFKGYRSFRIISSKVHNQIDVWNLFCRNFDYSKTYDGLKNDCRLYQLKIIEKVSQITTIYSKNDNNDIKLRNETKKEKIDINNASEVEITSLPGISIVLAKKLIKKREEIGGFKNTHEVFVYLKLKPHMENQLIDLICVNKMKGSVKIEKYQERHVDL